MKHLILSSKLFAFLFAISTMIYVGCQKEEVKPGETSKVSTTEIRTTVTPTVENGTLKFNTKEDAFTYMKELTFIFDASKNGVEGTEDFVDPISSINEDIKTKYGFTSLYTTWQKDIDGKLIDPVFPDPIFNLMINPNHEIIIGDSIFVHKHTTEFYVISKNDNLNRNLLRELAPNTLLSAQYFNKQIKINPFDREIEVRTKDCDCSLSLEGGLPNANMPGFSGFTLNHSCIGYAGSKSTWVLKWTDLGGSFASGTVTGVYNSVTNPNNIDFFVPTIYTNLEIEFCIYLDCGKGLEKFCYKFKKNIAKSCCSKYHKIIMKEDFPSDQFKLEAEYENGVNFWGYWHWGLANFRSLNNNKRLKAGKLEIWLHSKNRTSPSNDPPCYLSTTDDDYDSCTNCKYLSENIYTFSDIHYHQVGDVNFDYRGRRGSSIGSVHIQPDYCN